MHIWENLVMKKNGYDYDECCYEEMTKSVGGQSQPSEYWHESFRNEYENREKGWNSDGYDQSGMRGK